MTSYTPATLNQHNHDDQHNIYFRCECEEDELSTSSSSKKIEHNFMDVFRERLNFRSHRESLNTFGCDNGMLDEDLGYPPTPHDAPPGSYVSSLQSDPLISPGFRSRSRSDATTAPVSCRQGTIVLFPNRLERKSKSRKVRVRGERHSVCVTDLPELQNTNLSMQQNHLYVDTNLANNPSASIHKDWVGPVSVPDAKTSMWNSPCHSGPFQSSADENIGSEKHHSPLILSNISRNSRSAESEPISPFSNCAILIKESSQNISEQFPLYYSSDGIAQEFFKVIFESQDAVYSSFMRAHKCYDLIPTSTKLVVFDTELPVKKAFFALIYNCVRAAPLWDSKKQEFVGMLTITDFIQILHKYYIKNGSESEGIKGLETHKIATWREELDRDGHLKPLATISPSESLYRAVQVLCETKVHRLPVVEEGPGNIAFILTHKRLMRFLHLYMVDLPRPSFMEKTPRELGIGTWTNVVAITQYTPLIDVMNIFLAKRISALPVLDKDGRVVDIYAKFDAINLAADKSYNDLDVSAQEALRHRAEWFEGVRCCSVEDSLMTVVEIIVRTEVHRLVVVDNERKVAGIISLSDILRFLVLEPPVAQRTSDSSDIPVDDAMGSNNDDDDDDDDEEC